MSELQDRIQRFETTDPKMLQALDLILRLTQETDKIGARLDKLEQAAVKVGLHKCHLIGEWFLFPSEGFILPDGRPASFVGLAANVHRPGLLAPRWVPMLCETLFTKHRQTIEAALAGDTKPSPIASLATALGWRLPIAVSVGDFGDWLKKNQWRIQS